MWQHDSLVQSVYDTHHLLRPAIAWMRAKGNRPSPEGILREAMANLAKRGQFLRPPQRVQYAARVILGVFLATWHAEHVGKALDDLSRNSRLKEDELKPFLLAIMEAGDERAFRKVAPTMARIRALERMNADIGSAEDFVGFVGSHAETIADRFLSNFDSTRNDAAHKAVLYVQKTAVSYYLTRRTRPIRQDAPGLNEYLRGSKRLNRRTVLAVKLAYLPALLTGDECDVLRREYNWDGPFRQRIPIKRIAERLGFKNANALSRKLYRVREWCRSTNSEEMGS